MLDFVARERSLTSRRWPSAQQDLSACRAQNVIWNRVVADGAGIQLNLSPESKELTVPVSERFTHGYNSRINRSAEYRDTKSYAGSCVLQRGCIDATGVAACDRAEEQHR